MARRGARRHRHRRAGGHRGSGGGAAWGRKQMFVNVCGYRVHLPCAFMMSFILLAAALPLTALGSVSFYGDGLDDMTIAGIVLLSMAMMPLIFLIIVIVVFNHQRKTRTMTIHPSQGPGNPPLQVDFSQNGTVNIQIDPALMMVTNPRLFAAASMLAQQQQQQAPVVTVIPNQTNCISQQQTSQLSGQNGYQNQPGVVVTGSELALSGQTFDLGSKVSVLPGSSSNIHEPCTSTGYHQQPNVPLAPDASLPTYHQAVHM